MFRKYPHSRLSIQGHYINNMNNKFTTFTELRDKKLTLIQPAFLKRRYELKYNDEIIGTIQQKGWIGSSADVEIIGRKWEIKKPSVWRSVIEIRQEGFELPLARYSEKLFSKSGTVDLPRGEKVILSMAFFKKDIEAKTEMGTLLFSIKQKFSMKDSAEVQINNKPELLDKYPWLIVLGWILILQRQRTAAAAG